MIGNVWQFDRFSAQFIGKLGGRLASPLGGAAAVPRTALVSHVVGVNLVLVRVRRPHQLPHLRQTLSVPAHGWGIHQLLHLGRSLLLPEPGKAFISSSTCGRFDQFLHMDGAFISSRIWVGIQSLPRLVCHDELTYLGMN